MVAVGFVNEALIIIKHEAQLHVCGDVHVGENTNPTNKLVVEGKAYAREFHVNEANNWPPSERSFRTTLLIFEMLK